MRPETWYRLSCPGAKGPGPWELDRDRKLKIASLLPYHRGQLLPHPGTGGPQRLRPDGGHSGTTEPTEARHPPEFAKGGPPGGGAPQDSYSQQGPLSWTRMQACPPLTLAADPGALVSGVGSPLFSPSQRADPRDPGGVSKRLALACGDSSRGCRKSRGPHRPDGGEWQAGLATEFVRPRAKENAEFLDGDSSGLNLFEGP